MDPHDGPLVGQLHQGRHDGNLQGLATPRAPARYLVPREGPDPLLSAIRVTVYPAAALRALRRPCTGGPGSWSGLRRCTMEATNTYRW